MFWADLLPDMWWCYVAAQLTTITRREGLPEEQNFDILNSFQTELQEPPKHLFLRVNEKLPPLTPILQDKKQTDDQNQNILQ